VHQQQESESSLLYSGQYQGSWKVGVHLVEKAKDKKKSAIVGEVSRNSTTYQNLKYIIVYRDKLHCLMNTVTVLLELLANRSIRVSQSFMPRREKGCVCPHLDPPLNTCLT